jgi:HEAT repeat protein
VRTVILIIAAADALLLLGLVLEPAFSGVGSYLRARRHRRVADALRELLARRSSPATERLPLPLRRSRPPLRWLVALADALDARIRDEAEEQGDVTRLRDALAPLALRLVRNGERRQRTRPLHGPRAVVCCQVLSAVPNPEALEPLLALAAGDCPAAARAALSTLAHAAPHYDAAAVAVAGLLREGPPDLRVFAAFALEKLAAAHPHLIDPLLTDPGPEVRACLLRALPLAYDRAERDGSGTAAIRLETLARRALRDPAPQVREAACTALSAIPGPPPHDWLDRALGDEDLGVRLSAVAHVARTGELSVVPRLLAWFEFADPTTRRRLVPALERLTVLPVDQLLDRVVGGPLSARVAAMRLLGLSDHADAASGLAAALADPDALVRKEAALALAASFRSRFPRLGDARAVDLLLFHFERDRDPGTQAAVIEALSLSGDPRVPGAFTGRLPSLSALARERVVESLATFERLERLRQARRQARDAATQRGVA